MVDDSLRARGARNSTARAIGTFTKKIQRHDTHSVRIPPSSNPTAPPPPDMAAYTPRARLRAWPSGKLVAISDSAVGAAMAAPTPWRPRVTMSHASPVANPPSSDAVAKTATPIMNIRRLP